MRTEFPAENILELDQKYASQGDISGRRTPKKVIAGGRGHMFFDDQGASYLDFQLCNGAAPFGYANPAHVAASGHQADTLSALSSEFITPQRAQLSARLCQSFEKAFGTAGRVHFSVGGAQAIDDVLKICALRSGRRKVLAMEGGYHGRTIAASNLSASYRYRAGFGYDRLSDLVPFPYSPRCPFDSKQSNCGQFYLKQVRRLFATEAAGNIDGAGNTEIGAIVVEAVLGRGGHIAMPFDYLRGLRELADELGVLLVIDDIQMGFMRTGRMWTAEHAGIVPDIVVFGKAITNGMFPVSGFWARDDIADPVNWPVGSSHATFCAAPMGMALGLATMDLVEDPKLPDRIERAGQKIEATLFELKKEYAFIHAVNRLGLAISLDIGDPQTGKSSPGLANRIVEQGLSADLKYKGNSTGLVTTHGGLHGGMVMLAPPYLVTDQEIELFSALMRDTLKKVAVSI